MNIFTDSDGDGEQTTTESESRWTQWQRRTFYALAALQAIILVLLVLVDSPVLASAAGTAIGGFFGLLLIAYIATGTTRRARSHFAAQGIGRHFSDRYWKSISYLAVLLSPLFALANTSSTALPSLANGYIGSFLVLFIFFLPIYELSKLISIGWHRRQNKAG